MKGKPDTSDAAVLKATGRDWDAWLKALDEAGARDWTHKQIVAWLARETELSGWWKQQVTTGYEKLAGKRVLGETADTGFQVGVRRTYPFDAGELWRRLTTPEAVAVWLGGKADLEAGSAYRNTSAAGELRVVKQADRIRFTRSAGAKPASTVQLALLQTGPGKTSVTFHHEKLADADEREAMRAHWKTVADRLQEMWGATKKTAAGRKAHPTKARSTT